MRVNGPWGYLQIGDTGRLRKAPFRSVGRVNHASLAVSALHWRGILDIGSDSCLCRSAPVNPGGPQPRTLAPDVSLVDHQRDYYHPRVYVSGMFTSGHLLVLVPMADGRLP